MRSRSCRRQSPRVALLLLALPVLLGGGARRPYAITEPRTPCAAWNPLRRAWFGDLHVHTAFSQDASTQGTRNTPRDAYRFARGEAVGIQPYDEKGRALRSLRLARPLDFAAVTDHAELLGETAICGDPARKGHDSWVCAVARRWPRVAFFLMNWRTSSGRDRFGFCGPDGRLCLEAALTPWRAIQDAAEAAYDRSAACTFTSFVGYEWTAARNHYNLHRNVIFRNAEVPALPVSFYEAREARSLWSELGRRCLDAPGACDALVIPHNSNLSGGLMFDTREPDGSPRTRASAEIQARYEPLIEVMQHKGSSECLPGAASGTDELCGFELLPYDGFAGKFVPWLAKPPDSRSSVRAALGLGLLQEEALSANPFKYGIVASTDTHLGTPGAVSEESHPGHGGAGKPARTSLPAGLPDELEFNPGGLAALWAEENSRDALFAAMRRREAFGTSGPRIRVRFFGGWGYAAAMCEDPRFAARGYAGGVPMGGDLPPRSPDAQASPIFAVWALRDPGTQGHPGTPLQRVQIVKGWIADGAVHERVYEVAGDPRNGATVDLDTCQPRGAGFNSLCGVWSDPGFDPTQRAFYYARVVENPTCRWSRHVCNAHGVVCGKAGGVPDGFEACCAPEHREAIQERAWTSPIWYAPATEPSG